MVLDAAAWTAIAFLMIGLFLILMEVLNPGFFIAVPGGTLFVMGSIGLVAPQLMFGTAGWFLWPLTAAAATGINLWVYRRWAPAGRAPITMSVDSLPGEEGLVVSAVVPDLLTGKVRIRGSVWSARSESGPIPEGSRVRVVRAEGVHVVVTPA